MINEINLKKINPILKDNGVEFAGVFGSFSRGEMKETSDVDILVRFITPVSLLKLIHLERMISKKIGREVDLITEDSLNPLIRQEVLQDLKPIYESR